MLKTPMWNGIYENFLIKMWEQLWSLAVLLSVLLNSSEVVNTTEADENVFNRVVSSRKYDFEGVIHEIATLLPTI